MKIFLENMNLFSHKISFNYKRKKVFHSYFGIGLSFFLYTIMIFFLYSSSKDFFGRSNPKVNYSEKKNSGDHIFTLDKIFNKFEMMIRVDESLSNKKMDNEEIKKSFFYQNDFVYLNFIIHNKTEGDDTSTFKLEKNEKSVVDLGCLEGSSSICKYIRYSWDTTNLTIINGTRIAYKLSENLTVSKDIEVFSIDENFQVTFPADPQNILGLYLEYNKDIFEQNKNFTNSIITRLYYVDNFIDSDDSDFFQEYLNLETRHFSPAEFPLINEFAFLTYKIVTVRDDIGYILPFFTEKTKFQKHSEFSKILGITPGRFILMAIKFDEISKQYERVYRKLQNVFIYINGIFKSLLLFGNVIIFQFNTKKFNYDFINLRFESEEEEEREQQPQGRKNSIYDKKNFYKKIVGYTKNLNASKNPKEIEKSNDNDLIDFSIICNTENNITCRKMKVLNQENSIEIGNVNFDEKEKSNLPEINVKNKNSIINNNKNNNLTIKDYINDKEKKIGIKEKNSLQSSKEIELGILNEKKLEERISKCIKTRKYSDSSSSNKKKFIKFSKVEFLGLFLCCKKFKSENLQKKEKAFNSAESKIIDYFDILNYTKLLEEFEKLKFFFFDKHQLYAFEFTKNREIFETQMIDNTEVILEIVKHFKVKIEENKLEELDKKILDNFNKEFIGYINN